MVPARSRQEASTRIRVDIHDERELRYWSDELGCTREKLADWVEENGVMVDEGQRHRLR